MYLRCHCCHGSMGLADLGPICGNCRTAQPDPKRDGPPPTTGELIVTAVTIGLGLIAAFVLVTRPR